MSRVHRFAHSLALSQDSSRRPFWEQVYRDCFPGFLSMTTIEPDGIAQRAGIDRIVTLSTGKHIYIDEKYRNQPHEDICLEVWSDVERGVHGWLQKEVWSDFVAYAIPAFKRCYLLPTLQLQAAWRRRESEWRERADHKFNGFRWIRAENATNGRTWTTESIAVPFELLFTALDCELRVSWTDRDPGQEG